MSGSKTAEHEFTIATRKVAAKYATKRAAKIFEFVVFCFKSRHGKHQGARQWCRYTGSSIKDERLSLTTLLKMCQDQAKMITGHISIFQGDLSIWRVGAVFKKDKFDAGFPSCSEAELRTVLDRLCELGQIKEHADQVFEWVDNYFECDFYPST